MAWFQRVYAALGEDRWRKLDEAAKYTSGGNGHRRAQLFAEAMLGRMDQATLAAIGCVPRETCSPSERGSDTGLAGLYQHLVNETSRGHALEISHIGQDDQFPPRSG